MSERKYTYEQIVRALECCRDFGDCSLCPYENATFADELDCTEKLHTDALNLINRQKAEIEKWKKNCDELYGQMSERQKAEVEIARRMGKAEAVKEFAERVINLIYSADDINPVTEWQIDNLVAELTEGK